MFQEAGAELLEGERELLSLVRGMGCSDFSVTIMRAGDRWIVSQSNRERSLMPELGKGDHFEQAWRAAGVFSG